MKLSELTDDQLVEFMDSVDSEDDDGDFSSDDDMKDPNYEPNEISPEDDHCISQCLRDMGETTDMFIAHAVNLSLNISIINTQSNDNRGCARCRRR